MWSANCVSNFFFHIVTIMAFSNTIQYFVNIQLKFVDILYDTVKRPIPTLDYATITE